jgi:hypothetical protein
MSAIEPLDLLKPISVEGHMTILQFFAHPDKKRRDELFDDRVET